MAIVVCALRAHSYWNPLQLNSGVRHHPWRSAGASDLADKRAPREPFRVMKYLLCAVAMPARHLETFGRSRHNAPSRTWTQLTSPGC